MDRPRSKTELEKEYRNGLYSTLKFACVAGIGILLFCVSAFVYQGYQEFSTSQSNQRRTIKCSQLEDKLRKLIDKDNNRIIDVGETRQMLDALGYHDIIHEGESFTIFDPQYVTLERGGLAYIKRRLEKDNIHPKDGRIFIPKELAEKYLSKHK